VTRIAHALLVLWILAASSIAYADEFRPAYLQLTQVGPATYDVLWKVPALDENTVLKVKPVFPQGTQDMSPRTSAFAANASVQRWRIEVDGGLAGKAVEFPDLGTTRSTCS